MPFHPGSRGVFLFAGGMGPFLLALHRIAFLGAHGTADTDGFDDDPSASGGVTDREAGGHYGTYLEGAYRGVYLIPRKTT